VTDLPLFFGKWGQAARSARFAWMVAGVQSLLLALAMGCLMVKLFEEPTLIRVPEDGLPQVLRLTEKYYEPTDAELRTFGANFATFFMRGDSFSLHQDWSWCAEHMEQALMKRFLGQATGTPEEPGALAVVERLKQRTEIPRDSLEVTVDKRAWPWRIEVKGVRKVLGKEGLDQKWQLQLQVVRTSRRVLPEGLVVVDLRSGGVAVVGPALRGLYTEG
jgi:hypothetical protein